MGRMGDSLTCGGRRPGPRGVQGVRPRLNIRDFGGYVGAGGRVVRRGLLYRGGQLADATPAELEAIRGLGLRNVLDLRSSAEAAAAPDPDVPGAGYRRVSGALDSRGREIDMSPRRMYRLLLHPRRTEGGRPGRRRGIAGVYASLAFANVAYRELFRLLLDGGAPLLVHCTAGKDRTGIAAMLVLLALGVDASDAVSDYLLTNEFRAATIEGALERHPVAARVPGIRMAIRAGAGVLPQFGWRVPQEIVGRYGTPDAFFSAEYGLGPAELARLRGLYLA